MDRSNGSGRAPTGGAFRVLRDQQSVQRFASRGKHRFLITKAGLLRSVRRRRVVAPRRRMRRHRDRCGAMLPSRSGKPRGNAAD
ncbi:hypothetical protein [Burkholderia sp. IMCC1007]|uniref:hypothetical protein n=1 Tax=Burkholderia sp. IMCC1007 TaxID=3004104 RepID=UPI0022B2C461|nr:hypothetical protein [Burkholderia sp. IMCC1007]